jgi:hypothetical protein
VAIEACPKIFISEIAENEMLKYEYLGDLNF